MSPIKMSQILPLATGCLVVVSMGRADSPRLPADPPQPPTDHPIALPAQRDPSTANGDADAAAPEQWELSIVDESAVAFWESLVTRYRKLDTYRDSVRLVQVISRDGRVASRIDTRLNCEVDDDGQLRVETPSRQARRAAGVEGLVHRSPAAAEAELRYSLWLAPHMTLKFSDEPLLEFRQGIDDGFEALGAREVTIDDKPMVHVKLRSSEGDRRDANAVFDLFINAESMLIERIQGEHTMPDGATCTTTLDITPLEALARAAETEGDAGKAEREDEEEPARPGEPAAGLGSSPSSSFISPTYGG